MSIKIEEVQHLLNEGKNLEITLNKSALVRMPEALAFAGGRKGKIKVWPEDRVTIGENGEITVETVYSDFPSTFCTFSKEEITEIKEI